MPEYVDKALKRFNHRPPAKPQHQPHPHQPINYRSTQQQPQPNDTSPLLSKEKKKFVQEVTGVFLFYARAVNSTMLVVLRAIAAEQGVPTENTLCKVNQFGLCRHSSRLSSDLQGKRYGASHPFGCIIPQRAQGLVTHWRPLFPIIGWKQSTQQWRNFECCQDHQSCDVFGSRSQVRRIFYQCQDCCTNLNNATTIRSSAATNTNPNQ
jgi:hypothetical protein